jgi:hypothetical protein
VDIQNFQLLKHQKIWHPPQTWITLTCIFMLHHYINCPSQCHHTNQDSAADFCVGYGLKYQQNFVRFVAGVRSFPFSNESWPVMGPTGTPSQSIQAVFWQYNCLGGIWPVMSSCVQIRNKRCLCASFLRFLQYVAGTLLLRHWNRSRTYRRHWNVLPVYLQWLDSTNRLTVK